MQRHELILITLFTVSFIRIRTDRLLVRRQHERLSINREQFSNGARILFVSNVKCIVICYLCLIARAEKDMRVSKHLKNNFNCIADLSDRIKNIFVLVDIHIIYCRSLLPN